MTKENVNALLRSSAAITLIAFPVILMLAFALHFTSFSDFFDFRMVYVQRSAADFMATLSGPDRERLFLLPHYTGFIAMPFMLATALVLGRILFAYKPLFAFVATGTTFIGVLSLTGVFAAWLSFAAVGNVPAAITDSAVMVLEELTNMQGVLFYLTLLSLLSVVGLIVLGVGLLQAGITSKFSALLFITGNLLILVFMDLDNWMFIGALLILLGLYPLSLRLFRNQFALV